MVTRVGINGFGRIGRLTYRTIKQYHAKELEVVAINDLTDVKTNAHLLKWDSNYGQYPGTIEAKEKSMVIDGKEVGVITEREPGKIHWQDYGVSIVIESTGLFTDGPKAAAHRHDSVKKVIISAPATNEDLTMVLGVNEHQYDPSKHHIISNASCTTNGVAPVIKVLHENYGIVNGLMSTIHSYTNDQKIMDIAHKDLRRARAAAMSIIPTTTGAAKVVGKIIPELEGRLHGLAFRVPTSTVSLVDFTAQLKKSTTLEAIVESFKAASRKAPLKGIMEFTEEELVSIDFKGNPHSCIIDCMGTMLIGGDLVKVLAWYDNEWGYSCRLGDLTAFIAKKL